LEKKLWWWWWWWWGGGRMRRTDWFSMSRVYARKPVKMNSLRVYASFSTKLFVFHSVLLLLFNHTVRFNFHSTSIPSG
jgi:hypothetical protein